MDDLLSTLQGAGPQPQASAASAVQSGAKVAGKMTPAQAIAQLESSGAPATANVSNAASSAQGRMQVLNGTNSNPGYGVRPGNGTLEDRSRVGEEYLNAMTQHYGDQATGALAYTWGPGNVDKWIANGADQSKIPADKAHYVQRYMQMTGGNPSPAPTIPGQSNSGQQPAQNNGPMSDLMDTLQSAGNAPMQAAKPAPQTNQQKSEPSALASLGHSAAGLADTVLSAPGALFKGADYAVRRAFQQSPEQAQQASEGDFGGSLHPIGNAFGVTNTPGYQNEASQQLQGAVGEKVGQGVQAVAKATGLPQQDVENMAGSLSFAAPKVIGSIAPAARHLVGVAGEAAAETAASDLAKPAPTIPAWQQAKATYAEPANVTPITAGSSGRASIGAAGTSFAQQAAAEGVPDVITQKISALEKAGNLNPIAGGRHIEAGSLPVPVELTAGQASGDVVQLSKEQNARGKNPEIANRFNAQNGQLADNLSAVRDKVSPNVNVPSGAPTGQALVDAYKNMDAPIQQQITDLYAKARGADGAPALVNAAPQMKDFAVQIGPTRFNALPSNVQQIFRDAATNQISLPAGFEMNGSNFRPMHVGDLMDIDKTLSGAMRSATDGTVRHDIGSLRDSIVNSQLDPSNAGADAFSAYKTAQASARARFQAMDSDPAYKAAANDITPAGEPSALADDFARKYIAGGKTANVQNMMQNLANDPINKELVASALMDHIRAQAGVDLRTGTGNISQSGLNKAIQNLGDKTRIVLGPEASQTVERIGNVARYTQDQPRGSFVNNSNTTIAEHAGNLAKSSIERGVNAVVPGAQLGSWVRENLANRANAKAVQKSLEPGAGLSAVPLNKLMNK